MNAVANENNLTPLTGNTWGPIPILKRALDACTFAAKLTRQSACNTTCGCPVPCPGGRWGCLQVGMATVPLGTGNRTGTEPFGTGPEPEPEPWNQNRSRTLDKGSGSGSLKNRTRTRTAGSRTVKKFKNN